MLCLAALIWCIPHTGLAQWTRCQNLWGGGPTSIRAYNDTLYVSAATGVYRSTDGATSWQPIGPPGYQATFVKKVHGILFAGVTPIRGQPYHVIMKSTNEGATWEAPSTPLDIAKPWGFSVVDIGSQGERLYLSVSSSDLQYVSDDLGATWKSTPGDVPPFLVTAFHLRGDTLFAGTDAGLRARVSPHAPWELRCELSKTGSTATMTDMGRYLFRLDNQIKRSTDGGRTWKNIAFLGSGGTIARYKDLLFVAQPNGTIYRSSDSGTSWLPYLKLPGKPYHPVYTNNGIIVGLDVPYATVYRVGSDGDITRMDSGITRTTTGIIARFGDDVAYLDPDAAISSDAGETWVRIHSTFDTALTYGHIVRVGSTLFAAGKRLIRSTDNGVTWEKLPVDTTMQREPYAGIAVLGNDIYLATNGHGVWRTRDIGSTWERIFWQPKTPNLRMTKAGSTLYLNKSDNSNSPDIWYRSRDSAKTWDTLPDPIAGGYNNWWHHTRMAVLESGTILMVNKDGREVFRSTNDGDTWEMISMGYFTMNDIQARGRVAIASVYRGTLISTDEWRTWSLLDSTQFETTPYIALMRNTLLASTPKSGVWRLPILTESVPSSATVTALDIRAVPNPSAGTFTVHLPPATCAEATMDLFDVIGRRVAVIPVDAGGATTGTIHVELGALPNGIYLLRFQCDGGPRVLPVQIIR